MTALEEALDLLGVLATGSTRERATAMARGAGLLSSLSNDEKRELAVSVADKVAPHLVPVIESETGMDLTPNQVGALLQMARQLDADQVAELRAAILDDDTRSELAAGLAGTAARELGFDVPDDLSGLDEDDHLPPPSGPTLSEPDDVDTSGPAELDIEPAPAPVDEEAELARYREELEAQVRDEVASAQAKVAEATAGTALIEGDHADDPDVYPPAEPEHPRATPETAPVVFPAPVATDEAEDTDTEAEAPAAPVPDSTLVADLRAAGDSVATRRRLLAGASAADLWDLGPAGRRAVATAFPDGWQRRRAIHHLIELDVVSAREAVALARTVEDTASRRWVVASLVAADLLDADDLEDLVGPSTAARLAARTGG